MTERDAQIAIYRHIRSSIVCAAPNYTPIGWWECDVWAVTKNGYATEYEIKITRADLVADAKKSRLRYISRVGWASGKAEAENKHEILRDDKHAPSRFYYVVPEELEGEQFPEWAGVMLCDGTRCVVAKTAPLLAKRKINRREIQLCQRRMWFRYWEQMRDIQRLSRDFQHYQNQARAS